MFAPDPAIPEVRRMLDLLAERQAYYTLLVSCYQAKPIDMTFKREYRPRTSEKETTDLRH